MEDEEVRRILSSLLFYIFKYDEDPGGKHNFRHLRKLYTGLPSETKRQITQKALASDPEMKILIKNRKKHNKRKKKCLYEC